ncbi:MAG: bifunctional [glutamate--ammonia ligase]-adenylyl-L-tyrosine phosphorylase/[glutamate--ammonia-ligase] adenylyltransferase, partial [Lysobacter sp.]
MNDVTGASSEFHTFDGVIARALARLAASDPQPRVDSDTVAKLRRVAIASDFAIDTLVRQPTLLSTLLADDGAAPVAPPLLDPQLRSDWPMLLRRYRAAESTRMVWRDVLGLDDVAQTLADSTHLAETCLQLALAALEAEFVERHGVVRSRGKNGSDGVPQRLVVFGLGKLGGGELNFSSDVDLVYAFESEGTSDGARSLDAEAYFTRLG